MKTVNGTARELPDEVQWDKLTTGHDGPCEIWCDDTLVFSDENCAVNYPDSPASFPYDKAKCEGKSMLTSIWLALHSPPWQVFTNCAPLKGGTSKSTSTSTTQTADAPTATTTTQTSTSTTTDAPSTTTSSSSTGGSANSDVAGEADTTSAASEVASTEASTTTDTTTTETEAPATTPTTTTAAKCSRRRS
ncbi:hypothetical protein PHMEG_0002327 [Phytophthora megakarya]|uniref:Uncharacterized protein n=1 Tax=Phytophthora megakarya TaxID=4795 RepID=A0A225WZM6_9STRA|nr:hypothetical protein PHMEG_0002327 [Phytophthora megakarya]